MQSYFSGRWTPYLLITPMAIVCLLFIFYPMVETTILSLYKVSFFGLKKIYIGFENYRNLFTSSDYLHTVWLSFIFAGAVMVLTMPVSLCLALLANQKIRGITIYRIFLIWPYALSFAAAGTIWFYLFNPTVGIINYLLNLGFGIKPDWVSDRTLALLMIMITTSWKMLGYNIVFYLAGLQNIPMEILDAAGIDGANAFQKFRKITLPLLGPTHFFLFIMNLLSCFFESYGMIAIMTKGGPDYATNIMIFKLTQDGFTYFNSGYASAQSVILFVIVCTLTLIQFRTTEKLVHYGGA